MARLKKVKNVLVISGSDSSSGAGMQADCAAIRSLGLLPKCAVSCITSQNSKGLRMIHPTPKEIFIDQIEAAFEDSHPNAIKIGMLPSRRHLEILISILDKYRPSNVVLDPIFAPSKQVSDGAPFDTWDKTSLIKQLANYVYLITPNIPEAKRLCRHLVDFNDEISEVDSLLIFNDTLLNHYRFENVLIKGGHSSNEDTISDILLNLEVTPIQFNHPRFKTNNLHGTGCALSSLIAGNLTLGNDIYGSIEKSIGLLCQSLDTNSNLDFYPGITTTNGPAFF